MKLSTRSLTLLILAFVMLVLSILSEVEAPVELTRHMLSLTTLSEFLRELSFSMFIAFALIATVEAESRRELSSQVTNDLERIKENVFSATFRRSFPAAILDEIEHLVFKQNFIRLDHEIHYALNIECVQVNGEEKKTVRLHMTSRSTVQNVSSQPQDFLISLQSENPPFPALKDKLELKLLGVQVEGEARSCPSLEIINDSDSKYGKHLVKSIPPGKSLSIELSMTSFKVMNDYEVWRTIYPTSSLRVSVTYPTEAFKFGANALHRESLSALSTGVNAMSYKIEGAMLPHQGLVFWWCCDDIFR